jgi:hypothetical protein
MSGRAYELNFAGSSRIQDRSHSFGLAPHSFRSGIIEWPFEAADVKIDNVAHQLILSPVWRSSSGAAFETAIG